MTAYLLKSALLLAVFYAFFLLFMRKTTFFRFNRMALLAGTAVCLLLPLFRISRLLPEMSGLLPTIMLPEASPGGSQAARTFDWRILATALYAAGCIAVLAVTLRSMLRILSIIRTDKGERRDGYVLHVLDSDIASFSFMNHIVISRGDFEQHPEILLHESMHVRFRHSADLLLMSLVCALQWFNPLVWLMRSELRMLHEYEADEAVLDKGIDASQYQLLLVRKAVGDRRFLIANSFNHSKLKNRINMMQKIKTVKWARLAYLACLPLLFGSLCFCSGGGNESAAPAAGEEVSDAGWPNEIEGVAAVAYGGAAEEPEPGLTTDEKAYDNLADLETAPKFNGGDPSDFAKWVAEHLIYPQAARDAKVGGRVVVSFKINSDGRVSDVTLLESVNELLDAEALRVVSESPDWIPGTIISRLDTRHHRRQACGGDVRDTHSLQDRLTRTGRDCSSRSTEIRFGGSVLRADFILVAADLQSAALTRPRRSRPAGSIGLCDGSYCRRASPPRPGFLTDEGAAGLHHRELHGLPRTPRLLRCRSRLPPRV